MKQLDFRRDILPFLIATVGEFIALFFWLRFLDQGQFLLGNVLLWIGFLVERTAVILWLRYVNGKDDSGTIAGSSPTQLAVIVFTLSLIEIIIWIAWLYVADNFGHLAGVIVLTVMIHSLHTREMATVKKTPFLTYLTNPSTIFFSIMEIAGGTLWLVFVRGGNEMLGGLFLLIGLSVEHLIQGATLKQ
jgi:hypothetical protein